jgi:hypothetical protein
MALLNVQTADVTGLNPAYVAAAAGGDTVPQGFGLLLHVKNGGGAPITVTIVRPGSEYGIANPDPAVTISAGGAQFIRIPPEFADPSINNVIAVTYSAVTTVTVAVIQSL